MHRDRDLEVFIGRQAELGLIRQSWELAKSGEGQVVLLSGEAGIGKSRLIQEFKESLAGEVCEILNYQCAPYHANSMLYPLMQQTELRAQLAGTQSNDEKLARLEKLLAHRAGDLAQTIPLYAELLNIKTDGRYDTLDTAPERRKSQTLAMLENQLYAATAKAPVAIFFEDLHWIDPTSLEFIGRVVSQIQNKKLLLVVSHRPEWRADFAEQEYVTGLTLNRLGASQIRELARAIAGSGMDERILDVIAQRTDGIPLYIEEFTRAVLESGTVDGDITVPESLLSSLMARLDGLQEAKHVAQVASVIGRDFGHDLRSGIIDLPEQQLETALQRILSTGLVRKIDREGGAAYEFKHALVRDAAYESLLRQNCREIHGRIADKLGDQHGENVEAKPEVLALHYGRAGDWCGELKNWRLAGTRSVDGGAVAEAAALFENALNALESMAEGKDRDRVEMEILLDLAPAVMTLRGYAAQEPKTYYDRAYELARDVGDVDQQFTALWGGYYITEVRAQWKESEKNIEHLLALDVSKLRPDLALQIDHAAMSYNLATANFSKAVIHSRRISAGYDEDLHASHKFLFGAHDPCVCAHNQLAMGLILMGYPKQALDAVNEAEKLGRALNHPPSLAHGLWVKCNCYLALEEFELARDMIEETIAHCTEHRVWPILKTTEFYQLAAMADREQAYGGLSARIDPMRERGRRGLYIPYLANLCAMLAVELGHCQHALDTLDYSHSSAVATGETWAQGQNFYLRGKALQLGPDPDITAAQSAFQDGIELCQQQQAKYYELRSSMGLAEIHLEADDPAAARAILEPVYGWFTEGFDKPVLRRAKEILAQTR